MRKAVMLTVLALGATAAHADNRMFYLGAGVVSNSVSDITGPAGLSAPDLKNTSWKAFAGVRPLNWLAAELDYIDLGSGTSTPFSMVQNETVHADGSAWAAYAVGFLPLPLPVVEFYGKAGIARTKLDSSATITPFFVSASSNYYSSSSGAGLAWGIGMQAHIGMFGARLEYEQFNIPNASGAKVASLSAFLNF